MRQINRRNQPNLLRTYGASVRMWDPWKNLAVKPYIPSCVKKKEGVVLWDFKGEGGNSYGDEKQMFGKEMFTRPSLTLGHRGDFDQTGLAMFLPVYHTLVHIKR